MNSEGISRRRRLARAGTAVVALAVLGGCMLQAGMSGCSRSGERKDVNAAAPEPQAVPAAQGKTSGEETAPPAEPEALPDYMPPTKASPHIMRSVVERSKKANQSAKP
jgi:hypothetical protein